MLGFAFCNPVMAVVLQDYKIYISEVIKDDSPEQLELVRKFMKRYANDPRQKVLWLNGLNVLRRVQQDHPAEKMSSVLFGIFDLGDELAKNPNITIVDASLKPADGDKGKHRTFQLHKYDMNAALADAVTAADFGYIKSAKEPVVATPKITVKADATVVPAKAKKQSSPPDSLQKLFEPMFAQIPEPKRAKAAGFVAARIEGILSKEEWGKAVLRIEKYGVPAELVKAALRTYRDAGHLKPLRAAVRAVVVDGVEQETAAQVANARQVDLSWINQNWPLENLSPEMLTGA